MYISILCKPALIEVSIRAAIKGCNPLHLLWQSSLDVMGEDVSCIGVTLHMHTERNAMGDDFNETAA